MVSRYQPLDTFAKPNIPQRHVSEHSARDAQVLCIVIRSLWAKERRLGGYTPGDELDMDLETVELAALVALRQRITWRLQRRLYESQLMGEQMVLV